jgi:threonine/homoserine/homoserine lactone efflux protein
MLSVWIKSMIIGLSIAAPVGPIGLLCIRRTLAGSRRDGLLTGLGAATADGFYGAVAAFGLSAISQFLIHQQTMLRLFGGLFLLYLGVTTILSRPAKEAAKTNAKSGRGLAMYLSTFALTLTNPMTILSFVAIFSGLGLASGLDGQNFAGVMVLGVFMGSALWWFTLTFALSKLKAFTQERHLIWINRLSGLVILAFGAVILVQAAIAAYS